MATKRWEAVHAAAVAAGRETYRDPDTGYVVFSRLGLLRRGTCCGSGCRHCPYDERGMRAPAPRWAGPRPRLPECDLLFWSGGKDSYLAYLALSEQGERPIVLVTTYGASSGVVAHQDVSVQQIAEQAKRLGVPLLAVPLTATTPYEDAVTLALEMVNARYPVRRLVFGDLHLEGIRAWREQTFGPWAEAHRATLHFPLWHADYDELAARLDASGATVTLSAVPGGHGAVGQPYDARFRASLPDDVDRFGENGEFHTYVAV